MEVRVRNKAFWVALIPALLLLIQQVCGVFGVTLDFGELEDFPEKTESWTWISLRKR